MRETAPNKRSFGGSEARKHTVANLINYAGEILKGRVVLVPVKTPGYERHIDPLVEATGDQWGMDEFVVRKALRGDPLTVAEAASYGEAPAVQGPSAQWSSKLIAKMVGMWQGRNPA